MGSIQANQLKDKNVPDQLVTGKAGTTLNIVDQFPYEGIQNSEADDHVFVQLDRPMEGHQGIRWFIYGLHAKVEASQTTIQSKISPHPNPSNLKKLQTLA